MTLIKTLTATLALVLGAGSVAQAQQKVAIADQSFTGPKAIAHVIKAVINGPMDSEAEIVKGLSDLSIIGAGMDKGDGSADVLADMWIPNQQAVWDKYVEGAGTVAHNQPYAGTQQLYVPAYLSDKIKSVKDLKDPAIAALFDKDGNGKGEYWAGDAAWPITKIWQVKMKDYGLSDLWEPEIVSDATFKAQLKAAYDNQKPILFYYWTPEWIHAAYDLTPLSEPNYTEGCMELKLDGEDWLESSKAACATPDASVYVAYSKSLEQRNPDVARFLSQIKLDPAAVNGWILKIGRDKMDPQDVAEDWIAANMDTVNEWIK